MFRITGYFLLLLPLITFSALSQPKENISGMVPAGSQKSITGPAENFTGRARVDPLFTADKNINDGESDG